MSALPFQPPGLLTVAEYTALPEDAEIRYELEEGVLVMSPSPITKHQKCLFRLGVQLERQLPEHLDFVLDNDLDLQLDEPGQPGFVRRPDLVVVTRAAVDRVERDGGLLRASEVVLVIEVISPGSRRRDTVTKHGEYADADIPHYWILDIDGCPALTACHRAGEFGYADASPATGMFTTDAPFPVQLDLEALT